MPSQNLKRKRVKPTDCVQKVRIDSVTVLYLCPTPLSQKSRVTLDRDVDSSAEEEIAKASSSEVEDHSSGNEEKEAMDGIEPIDFGVPSTSAHHTNKPPTGAELKSMKDAIDLYQSSSFKLQVCICFLVYLSHSGTHPCVPDRRSPSKCLS